VSVHGVCFTPTLTGPNSWVLWRILGSKGASLGELISVRSAKIRSTLKKRRIADLTGGLSYATGCLLSEGKADIERAGEHVAE